MNKQRHIIYSSMQLYYIEAFIYLIFTWVGKTKWWIQQLQLINYDNIIIITHNSVQFSFSHMQGTALFPMGST